MIRRTVFQHWTGFPWVFHFVWRDSPDCFSTMNRIPLGVSFRVTWLPKLFHYKEKNSPECFFLCDMIRQTVFQQSTWFISPAMLVLHHGISLNCRENATASNYAQINKFLRQMLPRNDQIIAEVSKSENQIAKIIATQNLAQVSPNTILKKWNRGQNICTCVSYLSKE